MELWRDIKGYEGEYQVSDLGRVKSLKTNKIRKLYTNKRNGYVYVTLSQNNFVKNIRVHRLVADAFLVEDTSRPYVNHIDGNKQNNRLCNLERCTASENNLHAINVLKIDPTNGLDKTHEKNKKKVIRDDGKIYDSVSELLEEPDVKTKDLVFAVLKGRRESYNGHSYRYLEGGC